MVATGVEKRLSAKDGDKKEWRNEINKQEQDLPAWCRAYGHGVRDHLPGCESMPLDELFTSLELGLPILKTGLIIVPTSHKVAM